MLNTATVDKFKAGLRGELIQRSDPHCEEVRQLYNAMIDKRPLLIARCSDVADVISAVRFARETDLLTAIRGGGHNGPGLGSCDDGLVIDLSPMKGVRVDPASRTVRAEAGCTQGGVDHAAHAFGLAVPAGVVSTTGIAGLTLGGGHGYLSRKHGLTIDNLLAADVVLADGTMVTASETQHQDLFWALRGGGGNFGVVTSFLYAAHPVSTIYGGPIFWELDEAPRVMKWYRQFLTRASLELSPFVHLGTVPSVGRQETAWNYRDANWSMVICGIDPNPANAPALKTWARAYWDATHPYNLGAGYLNFMMDEGEERIRATYGDNYDRLASIKKKYDPTNFFRVNQNIKPA